MNDRRLSDKEILTLWRSRSGPINLYQHLDHDISYPCITNIEFGLNNRNEPYITSVTLPDPNGISFVTASPQQIYTGKLREKNWGMNKRS